MKRFLKEVLAGFCYFYENSPLIYAASYALALYGTWWVAYQNIYAGIAVLASIVFVRIQMRKIMGW